MAKNLKPSMRITLLSLLLGTVLAAAGPLAYGTRPTVTVFKSPGCLCCNRWVEHLRQAGFRVRVAAATNLNAIKARLGVPPVLRSCHSALVEGYVVEGHVPAADIRRLLQERPHVAGLAVPGMPAGAPGMERAGRAAPYEVLAFTSGGQTRVFARHGFSE